MVPQSVAPLSRHVLFQSSDLDCARELVARKFCRHKLEIVGERKAFQASHHHLMGDMISLNYIDYGADVVIDPGALQDFYLIQIPVSGFATIRNGRIEVQASTTTGSVLNPHWETRMRWREGCRHMLIQIRKSAIHALASRSFNRDLPGTITFAPQINLVEAEMAQWLRMMKSIFRAADDPVRPHNPQSLNWQMQEQLLLEKFLWAQTSNIAVFRPEKPQGHVPRYVRRAEDFIRHHAEQPITLADIASAAGCTSRTLQLAYQSAYGTTPLRALRGERMKRVRYELSDSGSSSTVADIALKWGFTHLGRFASDYQAEFGEKPSETRQARLVFS